MLFRVLGFLWLVLIWVILWGSPSPANLITGSLVVFLIFKLFPTPQVHIDIRLRPIKLLKLIGVFLFYVFQSSFAIAWMVIRPKPLPPSDVFEGELRLHSDFVLTLACYFVILVPGTIVVEVDEDTGRVLVHNLDGNAKDTFYHQLRVTERLFHDAFESHLPYPPSQLPVPAGETL